MAAFDLDEQEQISELKAWWTQYGKFVTTIAVTAAVASVGWQGWQYYRNTQANEAGAVYFAVQQAAARGDAQKAREAAGQLIEKFGGTAYAEMAALTSAGVQAEAGDAKSARLQLEWVVANGSDPALKDIARLRLASLLLDEGAHDEALAKLAEAPAPSLKARYEDLRGDVLAAAGKPAEARTAYQAALDALAADNAEGGETLREVIRIKQQALEG